MDDNAGGIARISKEFGLDITSTYELIGQYARRKDISISMSVQQIKRGNPAWEWLVIYEKIEELTFLVGTTEMLRFLDTIMNHGTGKG